MKPKEEVEKAVDRLVGEQVGGERGNIEEVYARLRQVVIALEKLDPRREFGAVEDTAKLVADALHNGKIALHIVADLVGS